MRRWSGPRASRRCARSRSTSRAGPLDGVPGVAWVERARIRRLAFAPTDPLAPRQWYAAANRSYDAWETPPPLAPVRVAVIDSGIDLVHPDLERRIASAKSFVGGTAQDTRGHGTIVAGIIAAELDNQTGIAGRAGGELLVAKVVSPAGTIAVEAEANAIRWAVDNGARGQHLPRRPPRSTPPEPRHVLATRGGGDPLRGEARRRRRGGGRERRPGAPHAVALRELPGRAPARARRERADAERRLAGILEPGRGLQRRRGAGRGHPLDLPAVDHGGQARLPGAGLHPVRVGRVPPAGRDVVRGAAGERDRRQPARRARPLLRPEQVTEIIERTAVDASASTGCRTCWLGRDPLTGWGALDATAAVGALAGALPTRDAHEPNDNAGDDAYRLYFPPGEKARFVKASVDFWDDQDDVYAIYLRRGERLYTSLVPAVPSNVVLALWRPGTAVVTGLAPPDRRIRVSNRAGRRERLAGPRSRRAGTTSRRASPLRVTLRGVPPLHRAHPVARRSAPRTRCLVRRDRASNGPPPVEGTRAKP